MKILTRIPYNLLEITKHFVNLNLQFSGKVQVKVFQSCSNKAIRNFKENKTITINTLSSLLNIHRHIAIDLISQYTKLSLVSSNIIDNNYQVLRNEGITNATIMKYPELLASTDSLKANLAIIKSIPYDFNDCVCLACLDDNIKLQKMIKSSDFLSRIDLMIRKLDTNANVIMEGITNRPFLLKIGLERLAHVIDLLRNNHVCSSDVIKDWWVLQYTPKIIQERIELCQRNNIDPIKTWMVRCTGDILERYIQRRSDNKLVLGDSTLVEYLTQRLQCTTEEARSLMVKHPALKNKSMKKMKEIIDFLFAEGYQPYHIRRIPKILLHSVQTTKKRIRELEQQGVKMDSLHMLTKSQRQYMQYYKALVKSNKMQKT